MATATPSNAFQRAAEGLTAAANRSLPEKIFQEALEDSRAEASNDNNHKLLQNLMLVHDEATMRATLDKELDTRGTFGPKASRRVDRKFSKLCEKFERFFDLAWRISECNQMIAKPVVGVICFIITIAQELHHLDDLVNFIRKQTTKYLEAFKPFYTDGTELSDPLHTSLKDFYRVLVEFCCTMVPWSRESSGKLYWRVLTKEAKSQLEKLDRRLKQTADEVHQAAGTETFVRVRAQHHAAAEPPAVPIPSSAHAIPKPRTVAIQRILSPHFTGRDEVMQTLAQILGDLHPDRPKEVAIHGLPGVGKTQLSLGYAEKTFACNWTGIKYTHRLFLHASDKARIQNEVRRTVLALGLVQDALVKTMDYSYLVDKLRGWLHATDGWLLIFDNVSNNNDLLEVRPSQGTGHIIYTTRNKHTAEIICGKNSLELRPFHRNDGVALVRSWMGNSLPQTAGAELEAQQVADYARGLPLAIEQIVVFAIAESISLDAALAVARKKQELLKQKAIGSFHEENLVMGSILVVAFEALSKRNAWAGALFQVLSYLEPSSIAISMLEEGAREMEGWLSRTQFYDRGPVRSPEAMELHRKWVERSTQTTGEADGPFNRRFYRRLLRTGGHSKHSQPGIPRVDSETDIQMQLYWQSEGKLKGVFGSQNQLDRAVTEIESSGLVKRVDTDTLWIHDLFAQLMIDHIAATESEIKSKVLPHTAATLVWLAFPITSKIRLTRDKTSKYLPHAESCLRHMRENGTLLIDATIGAELSHAVASTITAGGRPVGFGGLSRSDEERKANTRNAVRYYKDAMKGYLSARKRLMAHPDMVGWEGIWRAATTTRLEMQFESECKIPGRWRPFYVPNHWIKGTDRFGSAPDWRCIQTQARVGYLLMELEELDEAEACLRRAKKGAELIWPPEDGRSPEVDAVEQQLYNVLSAKGDWVEALAVVQEQQKKFEQRLESEGVVVDLAKLVGCPAAVDIQARMGDCFVHLKRWDEALMWRHTLLKHFHLVDGGRYGIGRVWTATMEMTKLYDAMGDWQGCLKWWFELLGILLHADDVAVWQIEDFVMGYTEAKRKCIESNPGGLPEEVRPRVEFIDNAMCDLELVKGSLERAKVWKDDLVALDVEGGEQEIMELIQIGRTVGMI